ncbi:MAG TPA: ketoacyl-ACP synthase III [Verrucomicrobiae bacterium]|nr:ketoacyl-ACP synthase III [Verrucomicrobiae bacterium]
MPISTTQAARVRAIASCVPPRRFDNLTETTDFDPEEVQKVVRMAGVKTRHTASDRITSGDLCLTAARQVLQTLAWDPLSVDALILVTQSPDYFLPSTSCLVHRALGLSDRCAAFDVGLGCSGYPYGLWLAGMMLERPGCQRVLLLHGETPTRFSDHSDRSVALLFGDAGSATALEAGPRTGAERWWFSLHTDGQGWEDLIIPGGGFRERFPEDRKRCFVRMNGANVFNFTIRRVPALIEDTLQAASLSREQIDYFIFHQSNQFIMRHLMKKAGLPEAKVPMTIGAFGSAGGPSVPLTIAQGGLVRPADRDLTLLLLGYGVGLSWGSALITLPADAQLGHVVHLETGA